MQSVPKKRLKDGTIAQAGGGAEGGEGGRGGGDDDAENDLPEVVVFHGVGSVRKPPQAPPKEGVFV